MQARKALEPSRYWAEKLYPSAIINANPTHLAVEISEFGVRNVRNELMPSAFDPNEVQRWIKALLRRLEITPTQLAKAANLAPSTLTRFVSGSAKHTNLSAKTIEALMAAGTDLLIKAMPTKEEEFKREEQKSDDGFTNFEPELSPTLLQVKVRGPIKSGLATRSFEYPPERQIPLTVPIPKVYAYHPIIALEVLDDVAAGPFSKGTIVFTVPFYSLGRAPFFEEFVVVHEQTGRVGGVFEASLRQFVMDPHGFAWLLPAPGREKTDRPIPLGKTHVEAPEHVLITAAVISTYRVEPWAPKFKRHLDVMHRENARFEKELDHQPPHDGEAGSPAPPEKASSSR
jgi:transcriptional regulator with XRE-family HTH domain